LAQTLLFSEELGTTSSGSNLLTLSGSASLGFLDFLQGRALGQVIGFLGPWCDGGRSSVNWSLGLRTRASSQRLGYVLTVALGSRRGKGRGRGWGREGLGHSTVNLAPDRLSRGVALLMFLLLALGRSSLLNLLGESERLGASNRIGQLLGCLLHVGGNL
jgi:hypothetical protein